jgi:hypothetical protein
MAKFGRENGVNEVAESAEAAMKHWEDIDVDNVGGKRRKPKLVEKEGGRQLADTVDKKFPFGLDRSWTRS